MHSVVWLLAAGLGLAPAAHAAPPAVTAQATPSTGAAPLQVTLTAAEGICIGQIIQEVLF